MKQTQKLDELIKKIIKEELEKNRNISEVGKEKLYPIMKDDEDDERTHFLGNDGQYDYYYSEDSEGTEGGTLMAQRDNTIGNYTSGLHGAYDKPLNTALKLAYDQKLLTDKDKKTLKQIELERRSQNKIKDGIFTLPDDTKKELNKSKKGLEEEEKEYVTSDGTSKTATSQQRQSIAKAKAGDTVKYRKAGMSTTSTTQGALEEESEEMEVADTEVLENAPKASEIAGQVSEILEKLKAMAEGGDDPKKQKHAAKVMKAMEAAKTALEAFTAHESMLEEKDQEQQTKAAEKHRDRIEKIFKSIVKDENIVNRLKDKLTPKDIVDLTKKLKDKGKELDEEKLARIVLNRSLKEGWVKKK
jgi:hypothetical protein